MLEYQKSHMRIIINYVYKKNHVNNRIKLVLEILQSKA